ncbi:MULTISPECIES: hypothetical protein [unclassified Streptomyces]|uniref:hypothetical protein n=1 Tax=unclassified Streptomyces TaxID=2593676 RepID=UPI00131DDB1B|nr:hypothetical protein [Streptomyces sp. CB01373]
MRRPLGTAAPAIVRDFVRVEVLRLTALMENPGPEIVDGEGEVHDSIAALTRCVALTIGATNIWADRARWGSELGARYLRAQREAIGTWCANPVRSAPTRAESPPGPSPT